MSDETPVPEPKNPRTRKPEVIEDAVVVEDENGSPEVVDAGHQSEPEAVEVETVHPSDAEPIVATTDPAGTATAAPAYAPQVIYVQTPVAPRTLGNRGLGTVLALVSAIVFAVIFALIVIVTLGVQLGRVSLTFVAQPAFYVPVLFYVIGAVLLVLIVNRAGWAAHVVGSALVGVLVYFGTIGALVLGQGIVLMTQEEAALLFNAALLNPLVIAAALIAREVSLWTGAIISRRGRSLRARNAEAREAYDRELAEKKAEHERGTAAPSAAS